MSIQLDHRTVWRWHFYAGLFCIPFVLWLAATGTVFLFSPQIQELLDRPYSHLEVLRRATANAQVQAALAAVPGGTLDAYQLPATPTSAAQVLVDKGPQQFRVYVHPGTAAVLKVDNEDHRLDKFVFKLHGELMIGKYGSWIVELAASWAVVMIVTGLFLWWPSHTKGLGGVLYPRLHLKASKTPAWKGTAFSPYVDAAANQGASAPEGAGGRLFWKDIHAVTGIYVSFFALFLLFTGLPWAKSWGGYLKAVRHLTAGRITAQDWTTSTAEIAAARAQRSRSAQSAAASAPMDMASMSMASGAHAQHPAFGRHSTTLRGPDAFLAIDTMVASVAPLGLAPPVLVSPPLRAGGNWTAKSDTRDRPLQVDLVLNGQPGSQLGAVLQRTGFRDKPLIDRAVGTGIAAHEGALFGWPNQLLSLFTTVSLTLLSVSGLLMWRKRKPADVLGAPVPIRRVRFSAGLITAMVALGLYFPFLGGSMLLVGLTERLILRRIPATQHWLGLREA
jgi:uncharacterized iron-regulated membrane protein